MLDYIVVVNNFVHDFAAGLWVASIILLMFFSNEAEKRLNNRDVIELFKIILKKFSLVIWMSILGLIIGGIVRLLTYKYYSGYIPAVGDLGSRKIELLIFKHVILTAMVLFSLYYQIKLFKKWKNR